MIGILGVIILLGIAFAMSNNPKKINYRIVFWGMGLQLIFALFILKTPIGKPIFGFFDKAISKLIRISLLTPNLGDGISSIEKLNESDLAWSTLSSGEIETDSYQIIYDDQILSPWKLIRKN